MNVFVLCTGRCGSTTFERACKHITNFTSGHETRAQLIGADRVAYPDNHIEIDHYLSWFLGRLDAVYGDSAFYVHLTRDPEATARTWSRWWSWQGSTPSAFRNALLKMSDEPWMDTCRDYVNTKNENIRLFLKDKSNVMNFAMESAESDFVEFWDRIGAKGDLEAALGEWRVRHNETPSKLRMRIRVFHNLVGRTLRSYR